MITLCERDDAFSTLIFSLEFPRFSLLALSLTDYRGMILCLALATVYLLDGIRLDTG